MSKINLFQADVSAIKKFINKLIYLYHLYTENIKKPYSEFINYLKNGWDYINEYKNDNEVKKFREELIKHYEYDFDNEDFSNLIKESLYEYITNYFYYLNVDINVIKNIFLYKNYGDLPSMPNLSNILYDYYRYLDNVINIFLISVLDFKNILSNSISNNKKIEISESIKNLISYRDKNFEFFVSLRIFIDTIRTELSLEGNNNKNFKFPLSLRSFMDTIKTKFNLKSKKNKKNEISLENFFKKDKFYYLSKKIINNIKNNKIFSKQIMDILNSHAHNPTTKRKYTPKESYHNFYLRNSFDLWNEKHTFIYDVVKLIFNENFLNLLVPSLMKKTHNYLIKKIKKNYHKTFCNYFEYILYLLIIDNYDIDNYLFRVDDAISENRFRDYNTFFNIFDLNKLYSETNPKILFKRLWDLFNDIFYFSNSNYEKKTEFILNKINESNLSIFNEKLVTIEDILNEINKIKFHNINHIDYDIDFNKIYIFLTIDDYKQLLNLKKTNELTIYTYLDFYNFITNIIINPIYFVISMLKSNDLLIKNFNEVEDYKKLCILAKNIYDTHNNHFSYDQNENFNTIYEKRILLNNEVSKNLKEIKKNNKKLIIKK